MVAIRRPAFLPKGSMETDEMREVQDRVAEAATIPQTGGPNDASICGVDQAFPDDDRAVSAAVTLSGTEWRERTYAVTDVNLPYIPGLLAFREGPPIVDTLVRVRTEPDVWLVDGNGRLHPRLAGLATHVGVVCDIPTVGVAKRLLCGEPARSLEGLSTGDIVPIRAGAEVAAPADTIIGHAVQTRQYDDADRSINPVFVSPGHRVSPDRACEIVLSACHGFKLPTPIRQADAYADTIVERGV